MLIVYLNRLPNPSTTVDSPPMFPRITPKSARSCNLATLR